MTNPTNRDWLALTIEEALEPELPICDPHHHLWDERHERSTWRYLLPDILEDINSGHNIVSTVFIECGAMWKENDPSPMHVIGETEFVNGIAAMSASGMYGPCRVAAGIISTADMTLGADVGPILDAHTAAGGGRFRGIRHAVAWDASDAAPISRTVPPQHLMLDKAFQAGLTELGKRNLTFEVLCYHPQLPELVELARACPDTTLILNHFGWPLGVGPYAGKADEVFEQWRKDINEVAKCPNIVAKLGGINMVANGFGWENKPKPPTSQELMEATRRYYDHTIGQFGIDRCMFESNFPVDQVSCSYTVIWNSFKRLTANYSADEKAKLYHDTAARIYRL